jgi:hypothetical protein
LNGQLVYVGDGIKVGKEGNKMPGVKRLHQESADVSKAEWIRGHYFGALGLLLGAGEALFAVPIRVQLQDGIQDEESAQLTLVDKMSALCVQLMPAGSYAVLDAYFAAANLLKSFRQHNLHLISRVRRTTVASAPFCPLPGKRGRGRPRKWGTAVKLSDLFGQVESFSQQPIQLYGLMVPVRYWPLLLHWDSPDTLVQFVLTQFPCGKQMILLSMTLADHPAAFRQQVVRKVEAFERFVNLHAIALGILQILALELADSIWQQFPRWFRTLPQHGYPTEQIVRLTLQHHAPRILAGSRPVLLLPKFLVGKATLSEPSWTAWLTG